MKNIFVLLAIATSVIGCTPAKITQPPVGVHLTAAGRSLEISGYENVAIRTFENVGKNRVWLEDAVGVQCDLKSIAYQASGIRTPAYVSVPVGKLGDIPDGTLSCTLNGETVEYRISCSSTLRGAPDVCTYSNASVIFERWK